MKKQLYIIRHGETDFNRMGIVQGSGVDTDLNDLGRAQASAFAEAYQDVDFQLIVTSKLKRTQQTVQFFLDKKIPHIVTSDINEIHWGVHEGKKSTLESRANYNLVATEWRAGNYDIATTDGETAAELAARLTDFIAWIKTRLEQNILIATHGRTLRAFICLLKQEPLKNMDRYDHFNTGLVLAVFDGEKFEMELENDISHLPHYEKHNYGL